MISVFWLTYLFFLCHYLLCIEQPRSSVVHLACLCMRVLITVSVAMIKDHDQKQLREERVFVVVVVFPSLQLIALCY